MLRIAFFTTTRAEFGIISSFIEKVNNCPSIESYIFVGGAHLKSEFGFTIDEIRKLGFTITDIFDYLQKGDSSYSLALSSGYCLIEVAKLFRKYDFDVISILGDRHELIPIVLNAILFNRPIIHWGGGEITEGVIDNQIRHMITKASNIHFVASKEYAKNIINMGEPSNRVFVTGSPVVESFNNITPIPKPKLFKQLGLKIDQSVVLLTYHPVTIEFNISPLQQIKNIFDSLEIFDFQIVTTAPNHECHREIIVEYIKEQVRKNSNIHYIESLGIERYLSLMPFCSIMIGNSSSGIFEAPFFKVPTVNIGDRQKGRHRHASVIDTNYDIQSIISGIKKAINQEFIKGLKKVRYAFGNGNASDKAIKILQSISINQQLLRKK